MKPNKFGVVILIFSFHAMADGIAIDKIYYPYVQPLEKELEYQTLVLRDVPVIDEQVIYHKLGFGYGISDRWYGEVSFIWEDESELTLEAYELELRNQLTEQGEYEVDWGLMFELEKEKQEDAWEGALGVLTSMDVKRWQISTNTFLIREWGNDIDTEWETEFALQAKYRYSALFEPGFEFFLGEDTRALGPMLQGSYKVNAADKLIWQFAWLFGVLDKTPDNNVKLTIEYEFF